MERFRDEGITIHTETHVQEVQENKKTISLIHENGRERVEKVLVATGQAPNTDGLALDSVGVETDDRGQVIINDYLQTIQSNIYAAGDVVGPYQFTH
ncbi:MAG: FAD-dependent oxidoreductase, partial [Halobacteriaceae archaeon]